MGVNIMTLIILGLILKRYCIEYDSIKEKYLEENNIRLIRIPYKKRLNSVEVLSKITDIWRHIPQPTYRSDTDKGAELTTQVR